MQPNRLRVTNRYAQDSKSYRLKKFDAIAAQVILAAFLIASCVSFLWFLHFSPWEWTIAFSLHARRTIRRSACVRFRCRVYRSLRMERKINENSLACAHSVARWPETINQFNRLVVVADAAVVRSVLFGLLFFLFSIFNKINLDKRNKLSWCFLKRSFSRRLARTASIIARTKNKHTNLSEDSKRRRRKKKNSFTGKWSAILIALVFQRT